MTEPPHLPVLSLDALQSARPKVLLISSRESMTQMVLGQCALIGADVEWHAWRDLPVEWTDWNEWAGVVLDVGNDFSRAFAFAHEIRRTGNRVAPPILFFGEGQEPTAHLDDVAMLGRVDWLCDTATSGYVGAKLRDYAVAYREHQQAHRDGELLRLLVNSTSDYAIFLLDPGGRVATWNPGAERLKGYQASEIIGQHFSRFYPFEAVARNWPNQELEIAKIRGRFEDEGWRVRRDGSLFWANVVITTLRDPDGSLLGFSKITRDMSERKQAEENARRLIEEATSRRVAEANARAIQEQRERLRVTLASIGDGVITTNAGGHVEFLNPVAEALLGWKTDEAQDRPLESVFEILNEVTRQPVDNPAILALRDGDVVALANHTILLSRDGTERPIDDSAAPIRDSAGQVIGSVLVFRDVSERRRRELDLRSSETRKSAMLATALDAIVNLDSRGRVLECNPAFERIFEMRCEDLMGKELADSVFTADTSAWFRATLASSIHQDTEEWSGQRVETTARRANGEEFPIELSLTGFASNQIQFFTVYLRDITERKRAEHYRNARLSITHALNQASNIVDGAEGVLRGICENLEWDLGNLWLLNPSGSQIEWIASWHQDQPSLAEFARKSRLRSFAPGDGLPGKAWLEMQCEWIQTSAESRIFHRSPDAIAAGLSTGFAYPIIVNDQILGVMEFFSRTNRDHNPELVELIGSVASGLGHFIERHRAEENLREQTSTAETLYRISALLAREVDLERIVQVVTDECTEVSGAQFGAFFYNVVNDRGESYTLYTLSGAPRSAFENFSMPRNTDLFGPTFRGEGIVRLEDVTRDPRFGRNSPYYGMPSGHLPVRSYLAVPVIARDGEVLGGLFFGHALAGIFTARHERLIGSIAGQAVVAIANARIFQKSQSTAERLNLALSAADLGDWSWDATSDVVNLSERAAYIFGIPSGPQMTWTDMLQMLHPTDRGRAREQVSRAIDEGSLYDIEYRVNRPDGRQVWVGVLGRAVFDTNQQLLGMHGVVKDIQDRKKMEETLMAGEERLRMALDAGGMGVWDWNIVTGDLQWSDRLEPLHGLEPGSFGGTFEDFQRLIHPDDLPLVRDAIRQAITQGIDYDIEFRNVWPDGSIHWNAGKGKVFFGEEGIAVRMIGICLDITHRKRDEQTARFLADASATLSVLVDFDSTLQKLASLSVPDFADWAAVDLLTNEGTLRRVAVSHVDPAKIELAHELHRRFPPDPNAAYGVWNVLRTGTSEYIRQITDERLRMLVKDEELLKLIRDLGLRSYMGVPLKMRGKTLGVISFISAESGHLYDGNDLTVAQDLADRAAIAIENTQLYRELRDADRRKDEFLAMLAHELRNPLAPIRNGLQVLKIAHHNSEDVASARSIMERQLAQMVRLVDDLLDVSRITRNKLELRRQHVDLATVIHNAVETSRPLINQAGHHFQVHLPVEAVYLDADVTRLAQVFSNLLNNSAKYTLPGGVITLDAKVVPNPSSGDEVRVTVSDNGLGIPAEAIPRIFDMFSQVDRNLERAEGGLGIGLTLVRRLVEMHGGRVEVASDGPGRGSRFTVFLPSSSLERASVPTTDNPTESTVKQRILVVDDNRDSALSLGMMLRLMGSETFTAHDGAAAVEAASAHRPDVILLDIGLPKMNGYEACRRIREEEWAKRIKIIALTGWGQEEDRRRSKEAGFDHHLVKPVEITALRELLASVESPDHS